MLSITKLPQNQKHTVASLDIKFNEKDQIESLIVQEVQGNKRVYNLNRFRKLRFIPTVVLSIFYRKVIILGQPEVRCVCVFTDDKFLPLATRMRPTMLADYVGQAHLLAASKPLYHLFTERQCHSMVFWGPPGTGKTTLCRP